MSYLRLAKIAAPVLAVFAVLWGAYNFGASVERNRADVEIADLKAVHATTLAEIDRTNRDALQAAINQARAAEQQRVADMAALDRKHTEELNDAKERAEADIAAVRAGELRLRNRFTCAADTGGSRSGAASTAAGASLGDDTTPAGLQVADAELLVRLADEADAIVRQLTACQAIVEADRH